MLATPAEVAAWRESSRDAQKRLDSLLLERGHPHPGQKYKHGWIPIAGFLSGKRTEGVPEFSWPQGTDLKAVSALRDRLRLPHPETHSLHQAWSEVAVDNPRDDIERLVKRLPRPAALRVAREADVDNSLRRFVQMQRPDEPEDPYA